MKIRIGIIGLLPFLIAASPPTSIDPGVRGGPPGAGGPLSGLSEEMQHFFDAALKRFQNVDDVSSGLGPRFNLDNCAGCHSQPAIGGTSQATNPEVAVANKAGATNTVPPFITLNGPVREVRFPSNGGGVEDLYTISGRSDAGGCNITQPDFTTAIANNDIIFRIPTPLFGTGLIEDVPDDVLVANALPGAHFNRSGNDGTITRFGWKAQNKSLLMFSGEAYNVEVGVTNELFSNERENAAGCQFNATPEDTTNLPKNSNRSSSIASNISSDITNFAFFGRFLAAPTPAPTTSTTTHGQQVFASVGCQGCHVAKQTTHGGVDFFPYSDMALHDMGAGLVDGITQGEASGSEFRTAPLWGVGQRLFFLHDGRSSNLVDAIEAHGGEAASVISNFNTLSLSDQQAIILFLRSL